MNDERREMHAAWDGHQVECAPDLDLRLVVSLDDLRCKVLDTQGSVERVLDAVEVGLERSTAGALRRDSDIRGISSKPNVA